MIKMPQWIFASDLHGKRSRFQTLFDVVLRDFPRVVLIGGDILPSFFHASHYRDDFLGGYFFQELERLKMLLGEKYPEWLVILGNDDGRTVEEEFRQAERRGLLHYIHGASTHVDGWTVFGYSYVPPTPFLLKDWEKYDVSRYIDPGCIDPMEGKRTITVSDSDVLYGTIQTDLQKFLTGQTMSECIFLFHSPPYGSNLDRAALDGKMIDHVPMDVHVGSVAIRTFIEQNQPAVTLHGHIHESARLTGSWKDSIGATPIFSAAHDGPELALVRFDPSQPLLATRTLLV